MVLAIGGNALLRAGEQGTIHEQMANARRVAVQIAKLIRDGYGIVLTHGNGPQVGTELLLSERALGGLPAHTLDVCDALTQGEIGYLLQQALDGELKAAGLHVPVATVVTQCVVSLDDPAMKHPTKPIGPFYSREEAEERKRALGWGIVEDASRGYRRVVPSPKPVKILEIEAIRDLIERGVLVIACGGGGIPVIWVNQRLQGVEAVIDKDFASALLACELGVELFVIATDTDYVYLDYKNPAQTPLYRVSPNRLEKYALEGQFPPGNMGPKVESVLRFLKCGGKEAIITSCENLYAAVAGTAGTHVVSERTAQLSREDDKIGIKLEITTGRR
jgi:carbamate kinase